MVLVKANAIINLPGGIMKQPGDIFMCKDDFAKKLIGAETASLTEPSLSEEIDYKKMTVKELKQFAIDNNIEIPTDVTKKDDIVASIEGALNAEKDV